MTARMDGGRPVREPGPVSRTTSGLSTVGAGWGRLRQSHIYTGGVFGRRPTVAEFD